MEFALREAKARLSELVAAARDGERVIITKHGRPAVELDEEIVLSPGDRVYPPEGRTALTEGGRHLDRRG